MNETSPVHAPATAHSTEQVCPDAQLTSRSTQASAPPVQITRHCWGFVLQSSVRPSQLLPSQVTSHGVPLLSHIAVSPLQLLPALQLIICARAHFFPKGNKSRRMMVLRDGKQFMVPIDDPHRDVICFTRKKIVNPMINFGRTTL